MPSTKFASADRATDEELKRDRQIIFNNRVIIDIFKTLPNYVAILNEHRQIIYSNLLSAKNISDDESNSLLGLRPGEALHCIYSENDTGGCGTTRQCRVCGAVNAVLKCMKSNEKVTDESRIIAKSGNDNVAYDFFISASPLHLYNRRYIMLSITDIGHEKRRRALEHIFFHDMINKTSSLKGFIDLLKHTVDNKLTSDYIKYAETLSEELNDELVMQRTLMEAESNELSITFTFIKSMDIIKSVVDQIFLHPIAHDKTIKIDEAVESVVIETEPVLLNRVITNMLKNALEASDENDTVEIGCNSKKDKVIFWVKNPAEMPEDVKLQIFQRSFSTKGVNRGLGTYSMKLLGERYLRGNIFFESQKKVGTTFYLELPKIQAKSVKRPENY